jgi:hypothetical protein
MEFLVELEVHVPEHASAIDVEVRNTDEAAAAVPVPGVPGHGSRGWQWEGAPGV